jgi:hypothetical protein
VKPAMTWNEWILTAGLSLPAIAILLWIRLLRKEMKEAEEKKNQ